MFSDWQTHVDIREFTYPGYCESTKPSQYLRSHAKSNIYDFRYILERYNGDWCLEKYNRKFSAPRRITLAKRSAKPARSCSSSIVGALSLYPALYTHAVSQPYCPGSQKSFWPAASLIQRLSASLGTPAWRKKEGRKGVAVIDGVKLIFEQSSRRRQFTFATVRSGARWFANASGGEQRFRRVLIRSVPLATVERNFRFLSFFLSVHSS